MSRPRLPLEPRLLSREVAARFWDKVDIRGPDECWPWKASRTSQGYGHIRAPNHGPMLKAHRVSFTLCFGPIPDGLDVLHSCDYPPCCNPRCLFSGTNADNVADRAAKGRGHSSRNRGEANPHAKVTSDQVEEIRQALGLQREIAKRFGVTQQHVSRIKSGARRAADRASPS